RSPRGLIARIGRQAVTWGNGLLFNPLDLFNPFAPTDIEREYKIGDDLVFLEHALPKGNLQLLYVPRRDPATGAIEAKEDSAAGKLHIPIGTTEFDVVLAEHFKDRIAGIGGAGYVGNAAWRCDAVWTFINESYERSDCLSLVANIDYSWEWFGKNLYGFLEFYYNGLGDNDYEKAIGERAVAERLLRGDLYTLGRYYLGGSIRVELDPLVNFTMTIISNMEDPSGVVQPSLMWDVSASMRITVGASLFWGAEDTEYGGFRILGTSLRYERADSLYIWAAFYF
ncbi:MAG: hypothetical protein JW884_13840, partial [Deltaproteobacteria bacterium]|nr:hypothetical protein [Deltaproteobacteria bacterium]